MQGQAVFRTKLTFRPHSTDSFTHRKMTLSLADRSQKTSGVKVLSNVTRDPEMSRVESLRVSVIFYWTFLFDKLHLHTYFFWNTFTLLSSFSLFFMFSPQSRVVHAK